MAIRHLAFASVALLLDLFAVQQAEALSFTTTGSLTTARYDHTATLLPNGKVLVAGGGIDANGDPTNCAELYNPLNGTWTATGFMTTNRVYHTATLLLNGKVLVAGGFARISNSNSVWLSTAELYNPATGTWAATGAMTTNRELHTATLLQNGKVLVTGGFSGSGGYLASAELYDPAIGTWTTTSNLNIGRYYHTATLLTNGNVLIAGGYISGSGPTNSAELFGSSNVTVAAMNLTNVIYQPGGVFQFTFTNTPDVSFIVYSTTNLSVPFSNWMVLNGPIEVSPGQYQFTDLQATNNLQRFYRISSP